MTVTLAVAAGQFWLWRDLSSASADQGFEDLLGVAAEIVLAMCGAWFWLVTSLVAVEAARGSALRGSAEPTAGIGSLGCPTALRSAILAACGLALSSGLASPALATPGHTDSTHSTQSQASRATSSRATSLNEVVGLPLPDRAVGTIRPAVPRAQMEPAPPAVSSSPIDLPAPGRLRVRPGDTLWSIAANQLPEGASNAEIATGWHLIHQHNRLLIGPDPDLIMPGTELTIPDLQEADR